jgi:hypothetical protein
VVGLGAPMLQLHYLLQGRCRLAWVSEQVVSQPEIEPRRAHRRRQRRSDRVRLQRARVLSCVLRLE